jgi:hypothetical protein
MHPKVPPAAVGAPRWPQASLWQPGARSAGREDTRRSGLVTSFRAVIVGSQRFPTMVALVTPKRTVRAQSVFSDERCPSSARRSRLLSRAKGVTIRERSPLLDVSSTGRPIREKSDAANYGTAK